MVWIYVVLFGKEGWVFKLAVSHCYARATFLLSHLLPFVLHLHEYHCWYRAHIVLSSACEDRWRHREDVYSHSCAGTSGDAGASTWELPKQRQTRLYCFSSVEETRKNVFFSSCEPGEKQYDHSFVISSRRNQHLKEFLGKENLLLKD